MTFTEWVECKILKRHPAFYLATSKANARITKVTRSKARKGNVLHLLWLL